MKSDLEYDVKHKLDHHRVAIFIIVLFLILVTVSILTLSVQMNAQQVVPTVPIGQL